jgi:hypothetical protein
MHKILSLSALLTLGAAAPVLAMPIAPAAPPASLTVQVQGLPYGYRYDPCSPGAPPVRARIYDPGTDSMVDTYVPASRYCRGGGGYYEPQAPAYRPPPRAYYEDDGEPVYRPRRPPQPGWYRDPYTGRETRILP